MSADFQALTMTVPGRATKIITGANVSWNGLSTTVRALWDTGAETSAIAGYVARRLGATVCGHTEANTPNGSSMMPLYEVGIDLSGEVDLGSHVVAGFSHEFSDHDMLIGMDVIAMGRMVLSYYEGSTFFSFTVPSPGNADFFNVSN